MVFARRTHRAHRTDARAGRRVEGPEQAATAVVFVDDSTSARKIIAGEATRLAAAGSFWVAYRKGNRTDINRDRSLAIHADHGMRPMGQVAIDDVWAGLALVPGMAAAIVSFQLASRLVRRIRPSVLISAGLSVVSAVCWCSRDRASTPDRGARRRVRVDELRRGATRGIGDPPGGRIGSSGGSGIGRRAGAGRQRVRLRAGNRLARKRDHRLSPEFTGVIPPGITDATAAAAGDTLAGATTAGHALPDHLASALLIPARAKFTSGLHVVALIAAAGLASVGILIAITLGHLPPIGQAQSSRRDGSRAWRERQADRRGDRGAREMRIDRFSTRAASAPASGSDPNGERAVVPRTAQAARDVLTSVVGTLLDMGMPSHEIAAMVAADQPVVVHRYLELHRERLAEQLAYQLQILARIEGILTRAILALESQGPSSP